MAIAMKSTTLKSTTFKSTTSLASIAVLVALSLGCRSGANGPAMDRPFPLGQVSDAHWETQQANAEASDFIFTITSSPARRPTSPPAQKPS